MYGPQWKMRNRYGAIAQSYYADFTVRHYGLVTVVFDVVEVHHSKTIHTNGVGRYPVVHFTEDTRFSGTKYNFLSRASNKQGRN